MLRTFISKSNLLLVLLIITAFYLTFILVYSNNLRSWNCWNVNIVENQIPISAQYFQANRLKPKDLYVKERAEYANDIITIDEAKVIKTQNNVVIYRAHEETYKRIKKENIISDPLLRTKKEEKKYIFAMRYYEQLTMATKNLLSLVSLATHFNRHVVMPFVNNSRFSGLRLGATMSRYLEVLRNNITEDEYTGVKYNNLSNYFDVDDLQSKLRDNSYTQLETFYNFRRDCNHLDVVIHFLYVDERSEKEFGKWYKLPSDEYKLVKKNVTRNNGFAECNAVKKSKIGIFLGDVKVDRYICVDPQIIQTAQDLEEKILQGASCVGIISWKGYGPNRAHFEPPSNVGRRLVPSDLTHNKRLVDIAYQYVRQIIRRPFISIHVRSERNLKISYKKVWNCINKLAKKVQERKSNFGLKKVFLANDLEDYGSGTLVSYISDSERTQLRNHLLETLENPYTFNKEQFNLYDRGEIAIVEMHILTMGESLFTLGEGNFQEWIIDLFLLHNAEDRSLIYKTCDLRKYQRK